MQKTATTLVLVAGLLGACGEVGPLPRCQALVDYFEICEPTCPQPACGADGEGALELGLGSMDASELGDFDAGIACLTGEAEQGRCTDCQIEGQGETCREILAGITGLACLDP